MDDYVRLAKERNPQVKPEGIIVHYETQMIELTYPGLGTMTFGPSFTFNKAGTGYFFFRSPFEGEEIRSDHVVTRELNGQHVLITPGNITVLEGSAKPTDEQAKVLAEHHEQRRDEAGQRREEAGQRREEAGQRREEAGQRRAEAGQRRAEAGQRRAEAGQRRAEAGQRRAEADQHRVQADQHPAQADKFERGKKLRDGYNWRIEGRQIWLREDMNPNDPPKPLPNQTLYVKGDRCDEGRYWHCGRMRLILPEGEVPGVASSGVTVSRDNNSNRITRITVTDPSGNNIFYSF
jgi:hypothetical protein